MRTCEASAYAWPSRETLWPVGGAFTCWPQGACFSGSSTMAGEASCLPGERANRRLARCWPLRGGKGGVEPAACVRATDTRSTLEASPSPSKPKPLCAPLLLCSNFPNRPKRVDDPDRTYAKGHSTPATASQKSIPAACVGQLAKLNCAFTRVGLTHRLLTKGLDVIANVSKLWTNAPDLPNIGRG